MTLARMRSEQLWRDLRAKNDWAGFIHDHIDAIDPHADLAGIEQGGYKLVFTDILVGEVWVAGGQSNMERQLGPRVGQQPIDDWEREVAAADHPQIRHFGVAQEKSR